MRQLYLPSVTMSLQSPSTAPTLNGLGKCAVCRRNNSKLSKQQLAGIFQIHSISTSMPLFVFHKRINKSLCNYFSSLNSLPKLLHAVCSLALTTFWCIRHRKLPYMRSDYTEWATALLGLWQRCSFCPNCGPGIYSH